MEPCVEQLLYELGHTCHLHPKPLMSKRSSQWQTPLSQRVAESLRLTSELQSQGRGAGGPHHRRTGKRPWLCRTAKKEAATEQVLHGSSRDNTCIRVRWRVIEPCAHNGNIQKQKKQQIYIYIYIYIRHRAV